MKKANKIFALFLTGVLAVFIAGCKPIVAPDNGNTQNDYDFKVDNLEYDQATVSWKKNDDFSINYWVVGVNTSNPDYSYDDKILNYEIEGRGSTTVKDLIPNSDNVIYLIGYESKTSGTKVATTTSITVKTPANGPVRELKVQKGNSGNSITISWKKLSSKTDIDKIVIYRKEANSSDYQEIADFTKAINSYTDSAIEYDTVYQYKVETFDANKKSCGITESELITSADLPIAGAPSITDSTSYFDGVLFSWDEVSGAESYKVYQYSSFPYSYTEPVKVYENITDTEFFVPGFASTIYVKVSAVNKKGVEGSKSYYSSNSPKSIMYLSDIDIEYNYNVSDKKEVITFNNNLVYSDKTTTTYKFKTKSYSSEILETSVDNIITIEDAEFATNYERYLVVVLENEDNSKEFSVTEVKFSTGILSAPEKPTVKSIGRKSAVIEFTPLTEEQLYGIPANNIYYKVFAYEENSSSSKTSEKTAAGSTEPVKITGLDSEKNYEFAVRAVKANGNVEGELSEKSDSSKTKGALSTPGNNFTVTEINTEDLVKTKIEVTLPSKISEDEEDGEEIEYGIAYSLEYLSPTSKVGYSDPAEFGSGTFEIDDINGGNSIYVYAYAQEKGDSSTRVYSDSVAKELSPIEEFRFYKAIGNTNTLQMLDIISYSTWNGSVRSTTYGGFSFGLINPYDAFNDFTIMVKASVRLAEYILFLNSNYGTFYNDTMLASGYARMVVPSEGVPTDYRTILSISKSSTVSSSGTLITSKYVFNDCVYLLLNSTGTIGISYK